MRVTVRLFARLRDIAGSGGAGARRRARRRRSAPCGARSRPSSRSCRAYERSISCAVNADYARMDGGSRDGDEVAFLPPVSGG